MELHARYTVFAEGCRGHLGKQLISHFSLDDGRDPQHYGIGIKEVWKIDPEKHQEGLVVHGSVGRCQNQTRAAVPFCTTRKITRFIWASSLTELQQPHLSPFEEFQRWKTHLKTKEVSRAGSGLPTVPALLQKAVKISSRDGIPRRHTRRLRRGHAQ